MPLSTYIPVLLDDLAAAKSRVPDIPKCLYDDYGPELSYIVEWERAPYRKMSELFGVPKEAFPPVEQLAEHDVQKIVDAIIDLWQAFNFAPDLPDNLPARFAYQALVRQWDEEVQFISEGTMHIEFCSYETESCPFPKEYCRCNPPPENDDMLDSCP